MTDILSIAVHAFVSRLLMHVSVDETLLPRYVNLSTSSRGLPFSMETSHISILNEKNEVKEGDLKDTKTEWSDRKKKKRHFNVLKNNHNKKYV